jgi:peptidyl-tRNA hydrolase, PTH1 family
MIKKAPSTNWLIVGLGNPGEEYARTFHNTGMLFVRWLAEQEAWQDEKTFRYAPFFKKAHLCLPKSYMNESGKSVAEAMKKFKIQPDRLIVAHDDSDLIAGNFKIQIGIGSAGHNGIRSITQEIGSKDFYRLRLGVRPAEEVTRQKAGDFVLKNIPKKIEKDVYKEFTGAAEVISKLIEKE